MSVAESAKLVYEEDLRARLEWEHIDDFVAIEPTSRSYFLGKTFLEVALAAKKAYPDRKSFVIRVGHEAAFHIGGFVSLRDSSMIATEHCSRSELPKSSGPQQQRLWRGSTPHSTVIWSSREN